MSLRQQCNKAAMLAEKVAAAMAQTQILLSVMNENQNSRGRRRRSNRKNGQKAENSHIKYSILPRDSVFRIAVVIT